MSTEAAAVCAQTAQVHTTTQGAPERLRWQGRDFRVIAAPIPWIDRVAWWETAARAPRGHASDLVERAMWQVQAKASDGQILIFDLAVTHGAHWPVTGIFD